MKKFFALILIAVFAVFLGCSDEIDNVLDVVDDVVGEQTGIGSLQWQRVPHRDIILQVPDNLDRYLPPTHVSLQPDETIEEMQRRFEELKAIRDRVSDNLDWSTTLSPNFVIYGNRIYISDGAGKNIHVFGLDGVIIEEERMSRPDSSNYTPTKPTDPNSIGYHSSYDRGGKMLISEDGEVILQLISTRDWGVNINRWYPRDRPYEWTKHTFTYVHNKGIGAIEVRPIFCMNGYMYAFRYRTSIDSRSGRNPDRFFDFSHNALYLFNYDSRDWLGPPLLLEGVPEIVREHGWGLGGVGRGFATENHIYIKSAVDFDANEVPDPRFQWNYHTFYVWTKDGKYVGKSDVYRDMDMTRFQRREFAHSHSYHHQSKTLYILETGGANVGQEVGQNTYPLLAFQQE